MFMGPRGYLVALLLSAPIWVHCQVEWTSTLPIAAKNVQVRDALELDNGQWLAVVSSHQGVVTAPWFQARSWTVRFAQNGEPVETLPLVLGSRFLQARSLMKATDGQALHLLAVEQDSVTFSQWGIAHFLLDATGDVTSSMNHVIGDGNYELSFPDANLDQEDALFITGGVFVDPAPYYLPNHPFILRLDQNGTELDQAVLPSTSNYGTAHHAIRSDSLMRISIEGAYGLGPFGDVKFLRFDEDLNYVDGFPGTAVSGSGNVNASDSTLKDGLSMTSLANGGFIVSGRFGYASYPPGMRAAMVILDSAGVQQASFLPTSTSPRDICAIMQSHDVEPDGNLVFSVTENVFPLADPVPQSSRIHVYLLDTLLNVLCDQVAVDGADDNSYYEVNRVKATADGGTLLVGLRQEVGGGSVTQRPWIMKLAPWDCSSGIAEQRDSNAATVWPNPGRDGFTANVNGPSLSSGLLRLFNAQGQEAGHTTIIQSRGILSTQGLLPGIYLYRIMDEQGRTRATGRWVKE